MAFPTHQNRKAHHVPVCSREPEALADFCVSEAIADFCVSEELADFCVSEALADFCVSEELG